MNATAPSPYAVVLEQTQRSLVQRARNHRNHAITVLAVTVADVLIAVLAHAVGTLAGLLGLVPISGSYFLADALIVNRWRSQMLAAWARGEVDLAGVRATVKANTQFPQTTLEPMLRQLPTGGDLAAERTISPATRSAAAAVVQTYLARYLDALLGNVLASAICVLVFDAAIWARSWMPLFGMSLLVLCPLTPSWLRRRRTIELSSELARRRRQTGFSERDFNRLVRSVT